MISYAQNFEDVILHRVFANRKDGFYIDVGAMDPIEDSVTKVFYDEGWSGINIEPNQWFYGKLMEQRPRDINLNLALGEREEVRTLHVSERHGNSTFEERHRDRFAERGFETKESTVRVTTLAAVCREYVKQEIDFLKVDCEGWEKFALLGGDWDRFRPIVVVVEATEPMTTTPAWSEWEPILTVNGRYEMVYFDGLNRFYLRREYLDLRSHFAVPPNVFDEFTAYPTEVARWISNELTQERDALLAQAAELQARLENMAAENASAVDELQKNLDSMTSENRRLTESVHLLEARLAEVTNEFDIDKAERIEELRKARLWIGQLSQNLAEKMTST